MVATPDISEPETDTASPEDELIRSLLADQRRETSREIFPDLEPAETNAAPSSKTRRRFKSSKLSSLMHKKFEGMIEYLRAKVKGYRLTRKQIVIATLILIVYFRPWLIPGLMFVSSLIGLITYLTLGPDRFNERGRAFWDWLVRVKPAWAERIRETGSRFVLKYDAFRNRLPSKWSEKLELPDFNATSACQTALDDGPDPFEKLKELPEVYRG